MTTTPSPGQSFFPSASNPNAPNWLESMVALLAAGAMQPLVTQHLTNSTGVQQLVSALSVLVGIGWTWMVQNPSTVSPFALVAKWISRIGGQKAWNGDVQALGVALVPVIESIVDKKIHASAGVLSGPLDDAANAIVRNGVEKAEGAVELPLAPAAA